MEVPAAVYYDFMNYYTKKNKETVSFIRENEFEKTRIWIVKDSFGEYKVEGYNIECLKCYKCKHNENGQGCITMLHTPELEKECFERRDTNDSIVEFDGDRENAAGIPEDDQPEGEPF